MMYSKTKYALLAAALLATACQSLTKLADLHFAQQISDAAAPQPDAALPTQRDAGSCKLAEGAECNLVQQCGCSEGKH